MGTYRNFLFYIVTIVGFSALIFIVIQQGHYLEPGKVTDFVPQLSASTWMQFEDTFLHNIMHPMAILLLQIITIIVAARVFGFLCKKIKQPTVIGEIAAGIFLGPSFVGMYFPAYSQFLFPIQSLGNLQFLSQIGLILFMFIIGMELDINVLKNKAKEAIVISHASIIFPFSLGIALSYYLYTEFAPVNIKFIAFALFIGVSMSITAFPVLARIIQERALSKTKLGGIAITCAAADDITAWCLLAAVIAVVKAGSIVSALYTILSAIAYVIIALKVVKPFLKKVGDKYSDKESLSKPVVGIFFVTLLLSSYATEVIGIHALFGAFMAGVIMPTQVSFRSIFIEKVEDVSLVLLLPLFFVFTGLRTQIGLLNDIHLWKVCLAIIAVAVIGKFWGSALAAKFVGQNWKDSLSIGALMNTRGLVELVVLNIGYDLGVLGPEIFTMLVIMALATTLMTGPALDLINRLFKVQEKEATTVALREERKYQILVSFDGPQKGIALLHMAHSFIRRSLQDTNVTMLHLSPSNELNQFNMEEYERESFEPIEVEAQKLHLPIRTIFKPSYEVDVEISETANRGNFDLLLIGIGSSVFEGTLLGRILGFTTRIINPERLYGTLTGKERFFENAVFDDWTKKILNGSQVPVGVYIDKASIKTESIFVPIFSISDSFLLIYAQKLIHNSQAKVLVLDALGVIQQNPEMKETISSIEKTNPGHIGLYKERKIEKEFLNQQDLMLISIESWKKAVESQSIWLSHTPSVLIIKP